PPRRAHRPPPPRPPPRPEVHAPGDGSHRRVGGAAARPSGPRVACYGRRRPPVRLGATSPAPSRPARHLRCRRTGATLDGALSRAHSEGGPYGAGLVVRRP